MSVIQGIYMALFGRPADPGGLEYWNGVTKNGADLSEMLRVLPSLDEYTARFKGQSETEVITSIYQALFGRDPEPAGLAFFLEQLASGAQNMATIAVNIFQGAQGDDKADVLAKIDAAVLFTTRLDTEEEVEAYSGDSANDVGRAFIASVTASNPANDASTDAAILELFTQGGQAPGGGGGTDPGTSTPWVDSVSTASGQVSAIAQDGTNNLFAGSGISADNFAITRAAVAQVELALKGHIRNVGDVTAPVVDGVYKFGATDRAGFAFSVASLGTSTISELLDQGFSFHLKIDTDGGVGFGNSVELTLAELGESSTPTAKAQDSGYDWVSATRKIVDDEGDGSINEGGKVTQNVQTPIWYGAQEIAGSNGVLKAGEYSVSLEMKKDGVSIATETIVLDVAKYDVSDAVVGSLASIAQVSGNMHGGGTNPATQFSIVQIDTDQDKKAEFEIALGGQPRHGPGVFDNEDGRIAVGDGLVPVLKWSVASLDGDDLASLLANYEIKLFVDSDSDTGNNAFNDPSAFTVFTAIESAAGSGALDWKFTDSSAPERKIDDDTGTGSVSQNKQGLSWLLPDADGKLFHAGGATAVAAGEYTVTLAVFEKDGTTIVGSNTIYFDVA